VSVPAARPASTVVLVRSSDAGFEVFLVKRHDKVAFMGGAHVFPGGRVDAADRIERPERVCDGVESAVQRARDLSAIDSVAYHVAALRELFEEAGILLARREDGRFIELTEAREVERFRDYRRSLETGALTLEEMATRERLRLALDAIVLFAHWVTPEVETKRFDTRFFAAVVPPGQHAEHDDTETTQSEWMDPKDAVARCRRDDIMLPPPTWTTLRMLEKLSDVNEVIAWARQSRIVRVQPGFIQNDTVTMLTLPGDATFPPVDGFEVEETRFTLDGDRWRAGR
jgi:8-oxo-dGTP pyrophosphatase MutT (NUDIX family)